MHIMTDSSDFDNYDGANERAYHAKDKSDRKASSDSAPKDSAERVRESSADSGNGVRLEKDRQIGDGEDERVIESSEDEDEAKSSDDEDESNPGLRKRGRGRSRHGASFETSGGESDESEEDPYASLYGQNKSTRQAKNALAAAEEEREWQRV